MISGLTARQSIGGTLVLLLFAAGAAAVACARWTRPIAEGDRALADGRLEQALSAYTRAERRFEALPVARQILARDYHRLVANQLLIDYRLRRFDELIDRAQRAPEAAAPHFWAGLALLAKGRADEDPDAQLAWLTRAEEELRRAVEAAPEDWDTKFNFELVTRLAAAVRKQPKAPPSELMQVLRPPPKSGARPARRVG